MNQPLLTEESTQDESFGVEVSKDNCGETTTEPIAETPFVDFSIEEINQVEVQNFSNTYNSTEELLKFPAREHRRKECTWLKKSDTSFSDALSDHNYTSQEELKCRQCLDCVENMLQNLIFPNRAVSEPVTTDISNFIDTTIQKIKTFNLELDVTSEKKCTAELKEYCSEPLEVELNDQYLENGTNYVKKKIVLKPILRATLNLAKQLINDCYAHTSKSEDEFKVILLKKIKKLHEIATIGSTSSCQALEKPLNGSKMTKHQKNHKAKMRLLLDTSSSLSSDSELSSESSSDDLNEKSSIECSSRLSSITHWNHSSENRNLLYDYNDGVDLSKYIKLEVNNNSNLCGGDKKTITITKSYVSDNDTDQEIDRLTNLSALNTRHGHKTCTKSKQKSHQNLFQKSMDKKDNGSGEDMDQYESDTIIENEDCITEGQFLSRYNEQIKIQLLNDSSSDSGLSNQSDYDNSKELLSEESDNINNTVDKFLRDFSSDKIDQVETDDALVADKEIQLDYKRSAKNADVLVKEDDQKRSKNTLTESGKHNKHEEIVLSSESDFSDVEADLQKSRLIKPMLRIDQLANETRAAQKTESERIRRLEKKHLELSKAIKKNSENINKSELILDYIESTNKFIKVHCDIVKQLKPHQIDGIKFMYDSCYGGVDQAKKNAGSGCILAHCMGLGKTLQLIALLHTVISYKELKTAKVLVLCPKSTVMNWADEFHYWLSPLNVKSHLKVFIFPDSSDIAEKLRVLEEWSLSSTNKAGCLLVGYEAFRSLVFYHSYKYRGNVTSSKLENVRGKVQKYLLEPGADLVVCDEGHIIKNSKSAISLAVSKIKTPRRIILTGTPIQNNLKEYYSMVNFIKPLYLGTEREFANLYANPIKNGQHKDSSKKDITIMKQRSYVLHKKLSKFVQRKEAELLKTFLPQKFEYVLFIPMTSVQNILYEHILEAIGNRGDCRGKSLITDYTVLRKIWTHPKVLEDAWKNATIQRSKKEIKKIPCPNSEEDQPDDIYDSQTGVMSVTNDWWRRYLTKSDLESVIPSNKLRIMFSILRMCEEKGEKCLIFSAFVAVLNVVEYFFKRITESDPELFYLAHVPSSHKPSGKWISGQDYYRLDGRTPKNIRHEMIKRFNSEVNKRARVFLISARAGGQGINLIGANRVIILDTSWNPSNDQQNIFRVFRLGQKKNCYIYRLIAMGTMEEKVYSRSVTKQAMSFRVVDEQQIDRHYNMEELAELYTLTKPKKSERTMPVLPKDTILAHLLRQSELVYKYHEHDSLLENKVEQELSEQEKADAWETYEKELEVNLEQKEGLHAETGQSSIPTSRLSSYLAPIPSLDMQNLLNYSIQPTTFMPQLNYNMNQNYLNNLNYYQKYSLRYPDISSCLNDNSYVSPYNPINQSNHNFLSASVPSVPNSSSSIAPNDIFQRHSKSIEQSNLNTNKVLSFEQYKNFLESPFSSLMNFSNQSYDASTNKAKFTDVGDNEISRKERLSAFDPRYTQSVCAANDSIIAKNINTVDLTHITADEEKSATMVIKDPVSNSSKNTNQRKRKVPPYAAVHKDTTNLVVNQNSSLENITRKGLTNCGMQNVPLASPPQTIRNSKQPFAMSTSTSDAASSTTRYDRSNIVQKNTVSDLKLVSSVSLNKNANSKSGVFNKTIQHSTKSTIGDPKDTPSLNHQNKVRNKVHEPFSPFKDNVGRNVSNDNVEIDVCSIGTPLSTRKRSAGTQDEDLNLKKNKL
ncbi:transcriptional regulator ATRX-like isoform X1 [Drosophila pseudoobscura]|uniref:Transcriptional regulator ATRX-like isoform X1 n=1 Tax=Drosophila pseudoobscura pseudoobscura TaxID=46245 RepID=A0A6I8W0I6_DROPS|nr:transcriptional regulator ATRX isoform X1 [Drosophila pseudoobscura]XP_033236838.1 transcriptional regulator ATRX isoform X1 [Drosophila pseudoobscura]XP_033236839.1 transcriptional regulator ATRX isoform X1 [Drosophila pseudoobscura]